MGNNRTLFLIPTPLSENTVDEVLSNQVRAAAQHLDVFFVENIRTARRFISSLKLGRIIDEITFVELHKDTPASDTREQIKMLQTDAGVLSEAGCPGIADPGAVAVKYAHEFGVKVVPLAGPSAILMALMSSGMNGQSFVFHGYLPIDKQERRKMLLRMEKDARQLSQTQVFMETPFRNNQLMDTIMECCDPGTMICVASGITAGNEFIKALPVKLWRSQKPELHKIPTVFVMG
jgi:16S rRNA (cytidine1402-2'-O)-methyltransferase